MCRRYASQSYSGGEQPGHMIGVGGRVKLNLKTLNTTHSLTAKLFKGYPNADLTFIHANYLQ